MDSAATPSTHARVARAARLAASVGAVVSVVVLVAACSALIDASAPQCTVDADCAARGGDFAGLSCVNSVCIAHSGPGHVDAGPDGSGDAKTEGAPTSDASGAGDAGAFGEGGIWACVGHHPAPKPTTATIKYTLQLIEFPSGVPTAGVPVKACPIATDPSCDLPEDTQVTDANGFATFPALDTSAGPFAGYFKVETAIAPSQIDAGGDAGGDAGPDGAADARPDAPADATTLDASAADAAADASAHDPNAIVPSRIVYTDYPLATDFSDSWYLVSYGTVNSIIAQFGVPSPDPSLGLVFLTVIDCNGTDNAAGVTVSVDTLSTTPGSVTANFYQTGLTFSGNATQTDPSGVAGFVNVPIGTRSFTGQLANTQTVVGTLSTYAYPGEFTFSYLAPPFTAN